MQKRLWIGCLFGAICLYFACRDISLERFVQTFSQAEIKWVFLAVIIYCCGFFLRSERWAILLRPVRAIAARDLFWPMLIGFFANNILPLRMGEIVRAHVCGSKFKISRTASLGSIFLERICDTLAFLTTFLVASLFYPFPRYMEKGAWLLGAVCLLAIGLLIFIRGHESRFHALLDKSPLPVNWNQRFKHVARQFIESTSGITQPRYILEAMALSLLVWIVEGTYLFIMMKAFAIPLMYGQAFFLLFALGLSVTLPQAPGYVGTYEFFGVTALSLLGVPKSQGLPLILVVHTTQFIFIAIFGVIALWREGLSFRSLTATNK